MNFTNRLAFVNCFEFACRLLELGKLIVNRLPSRVRSIIGCSARFECVRLIFNARWDEPKDSLPFRTEYLVDCAAMPNQGKYLGVRDIETEVAADIGELAILVQTQLTPPNHVV